MSTETALEVFIGTYDSYLLSYKIRCQDGRTFLERFISQNTHTGSVRCVSGRARYLATGGSDDRIIVMDLKKNQEIQMLTHHSGTINQLEFSPDGKFLFSASDDGSLAATKIGSWITDNVWRTPHSGKPITNFAIHPTGKLALTVGKDGTLRTWSLIKGRQVFTTNLKTLTPKGETVERVVWSPSGSLFALITVDKVLVMSVGSGGIVREFAGKSRTTCLCWLDDDQLVLGQMDGKIRFETVEEESSVTVDAHDCRIKDMAISGSTLVTIASHGSEGHITVWHLDTDELSLTEVCGTTLNRRPICMALVDATLYRPEPVVKAETTAGDEAVPKVAKVVGRKMVTAGRVTIEKEEDYANVSSVSLFQAAAPKKQKKKKRAAAEAAAAPEEDEVDEEETPKKKKKSKQNRTAAEHTPAVTPVVSQKKSKVRASSGFTESPIVVTPTASSTKKMKANKRSVEEEIAVGPVAGKKSKKSSDTLNQSTGKIGGKKKPAKADRRKTITF